MIKLKDLIMEAKVKVTVTPLTKLLKNGGFNRSTGRAKKITTSTGHDSSWKYSYKGEGYIIDRSRGSDTVTIDYHPGDKYDETYIKRMAKYLDKKGVEYSSDNILSFITVDLRQFFK